MGRWRTKVFVRVFRAEEDLNTTVLREKEHGWHVGSSFLWTGDGSTPGGRRVLCPGVLHVYHERGGLVFRGPAPSLWGREMEGLRLQTGQIVHRMDGNSLWVGDGRASPGVRIDLEG